ncbi:DNA-dependent RNA polymerase a subunit [Lymphocystis disease virus 3]|uniref:DNA-directed RNA polymerase subunit n=1 Tax=Lymphocystis disease virus 3 TaxID=2560566 RepID=A0A1B2RW77_9VIRU|nr:DNA-dependent RNA polymerase a subunit [Lymphocystis disease virus Sa]AOC55245.1 DNA-dependent RNA polymerase a subunit [Lymphocystis disease virus 3]
MDLKKFKFGLMSDSIVLENSVSETTKCCLKQERGSVYDPYLGGTNGLCLTCGQDQYKCPGHFGHINLEAPVLIFYKEAAAILKKYCWTCGKTIKSCVDCSSNVLCVKIVENEIGLPQIQVKRKNGSKYVLEPEDLKRTFEKINAPEHVHPKHLILTKFPVLPPCCRPQTPLADDDLSVFLSQIVKLNEKLKVEKCPKIIDQLRLKILCYVDNTKGKATHNTNHKPMTGIKERLSKKTGILRQNMMGKRRNQTARSVVGPDSTLKLDEVAIPYEIADNLTVPVRITSFNLESIRKYKIASVIKADGSKYCVPENSRRYALLHGDSLSHGGKVTDCKTETQESFDHERLIKPLPDIEPGDIIERFLEDGDPVILNRQPTLHRNSMLGMKIIKKPGKTIRVNLAVTHGFNMDFDGDEGNLYLPQGEEARWEVQDLMNPARLIVSNKSPQAEIFPVQDAVLGAYLMTRYPKMSKEEYFDCAQLLNFYPSKVGTSLDLIKRILPKDFLIESSDLKITNGFIKKGCLTGSKLKIIIRYLALEYSNQEAVKFIEGIQDLTNRWLRHRPFSVGIKDCVDLKRDVIDQINSYYLKANKAYDEAPGYYKETAAEMILNSVRDDVVKNLKPSKDNALLIMAQAGSKGDRFNLTQIGGLLGQQYVDGRRPGYETDESRLTLAGYPRVVVNPKQKYESRGFVASCFIDGLNPKECFFHAKSGREGMINTSQTTGVTGYAERRMVKLNENIVIKYDYSVRDAAGQTVQFIYGGHGLNPMHCFTQGVPLCFKRLAFKLNETYKGPKIIPNTTDLLDLSFFQFLPEPLRERTISFHLNNVKKGAVLIPQAAVEIWHKTVKNAYIGAMMPPGEAVGIVCAQAIGAKQTQQTLNTFHRAGTLSEAGHRQFGEILSLTQKPKKRSCCLKLKNVPSDPSDIRDFLGCSLICVPLGDCLEPGAFKTIVLKTGAHLEIKLNLNVCFKHRISPEDVAQSMIQKFEEPYFKIETGFNFVRLSWKNKCCLNKIVKDVLKLKIGLVPGVIDYDLRPVPQSDPVRYVAVTKGSNLQKLLAHPAVDAFGSVCDDVWDVYKTLGLATVRKRLREMIKNCVGEDIYPEHIELLVDQMTYKGKPMPIDRYTMRTHKVGPLSRAAFEESLDILINSAVNGETDELDGVSACVVAGKRSFIGTGFPQLIYDVNTIS